MATLLSLLFFLLLYLSGFLQSGGPDASVVSGAQLAVGVVFLLIGSLAKLLILPVLRRAESRGSPRAIELYLKDGKAQLSWSLCLLFGFFSIALAAFPFVGATSSALLLWILLLGLSIDLIALYLRGCHALLDPFLLMERYGARGKAAVAANGDSEITTWLNALSTATLHAVHQGNFSLVRSGLSEVTGLTRELIHSKLARAEDPATDPYTAYVLGFTYERLSFIHETALEEGLRPVSSNLLSELGKQVVMLTKRVGQLAPLAVAQMGQIADEADHMDMPDVMDKASFAMVGVVRAIMDEDLSHIDVRDTFGSIVSHLEEIAKAQFARDKEIELAVLVKPLKDMEELLNQEPHNTRDDIQIVLKDLNRVFGDFAAVGLVMQRKKAMEAKSEEPNELQAEAAPESPEEPVENEDE